MILVGKPIARAGRVNPAATRIPAMRESLVVWVAAIGSRVAVIADAVGRAWTDLVAVAEVEVFCT
jgi:hypothetical protein